MAAHDAVPPLQLQERTGQPAAEPAPSAPAAAAQQQLGEAGLRNEPYGSPKRGDAEAPDERQPGSCGGRAFQRAGASLARRGDAFRGAGLTVRGVAVALLGAGAAVSFLVALLLPESQRTAAALSAALLCASLWALALQRECWLLAAPHLATGASLQSVINNIRAELPDRAASLAAATAGTDLDVLTFARTQGMVSFSVDPAGQAMQTMLVSSLVNEHKRCVSKLRNYESKFGALPGVPGADAFCTDWTCGVDGKREPAFANEYNENYFTEDWQHFGSGLPSPVLCSVEESPRGDPRCGSPLRKHAGASEQVVSMDGPGVTPRCGGPTLPGVAAAPRSLSREPPGRSFSRERLGRSNSGLSAPGPALQQRASDQPAASPAEASPSQADMDNTCDLPLWLRQIRG